MDLLGALPEQRERDREIWTEWLWEQQTGGYAPSLHSLIISGPRVLLLTMLRDQRANVDLALDQVLL